MVIQRWQTLLLLLSGISAAWACFVPFGQPGQGDGFYPTEVPVTLILMILGAVLAIAGIFLFRDLKRQMTTAILAMLADLLSTGIGLYYSGTWFPSGAAPFLLIAAALLALAARWRIAADRKLLRSADRLR